MWTPALIVVTGGSASEFLAATLQVLKATNEEERLLGQVIEIALGQLVEGFDGDRKSVV